MFPWNLFPFDKGLQNKWQQMKPEEINQYVQKAMEQMSKMFHPSAQAFINPEEFLRPLNSAEQKRHSFSSHEKESRLQYSVYETHDYIYVRVFLKEESWLQRMKLFYTSNLLIIENIPSDGEKHTIPLPSLVKKKGSTAKYKDDILEIKILKNIDMQFSEIEINEK